MPCKIAFLVLSLATMVNPADAQPMPIGGATSQPVGHYEFCRNHKSECEPNPSVASPVRMAPDTIERLQALNVSVNRSVRPLSDLVQHGVDEHWSYPISNGDCEDFALLKRRRLMSLGFHPSNLLITIVERRDGERHAILTVRTDAGAYILDNLDDTVRHWTHFPYRYVKRQAIDHSGRWVSILRRA